ncbi:hypothetical protein GCM10027347_53400 [Larkinella harenae]
MLTSTASHRPWQPSVGKLINTQIDRPALKYGFVGLLLLLTFPYLDFVHTPTEGIDNSWRIALELIHQKGLIWGQDVIFTYGPLGRWLQRYTIITSPAELLLVDLFFALNVACLLYSFLPNPLKLWHLPVYFLIWAIVNGMWGEWIHFTWFYIVIYWGIRLVFQPAPNRGLLIYLTVVCTINFYLKVNFGLIAIGYLGVLVGYLFWDNRLTTGQLLEILGLQILLVVLGAYWLRTDLIRYVTSSVHVITGYNESQAIFPHNRLRIVAFSYASFLLQVFLALVYVVKRVAGRQKLDRQHRNTIFALFWALTISFIVLKYAFTRADDGHLTAFVKQSSLVLILLAVCVQEERLRKAVFGLLLLNCGSYLILYVPLFGKIPANHAMIFPHKIQLVMHYFQMAAHQTYPDPQPTIPPSIRQKIGRQTTDVIPNDIAEVYFNGLNYNPRPTLQSYQSYTSFLDHKNREKYLSSTAPDWVIYRYESIDGKYPLADETQTLLAILQRYHVDDQSDKRLFLKKNSQTKALTLISQQTVQLRMGEKLQVQGPDSLLHVLYAKTHYTFCGKMLGVLFQPPQLTMTLEAENHTAVQYRAIPLLLEKGLLINSRVDDLNDAREFLTTQRVRNKRLTGLRFHQANWDPIGFEPVMEVTIQSYQSQTPH